jgi:hypothetical protein
MLGALGRARQLHESNREARTSIRRGFTDSLFGR